jgi:uncharacterized protein YfdQ (DUF2303 family)
MDAEAVRELVDSIARPELHELGTEHAIITLPPEFKIEDAKRFLPPPSRPQQKVQLTTVESFVAYVNRYRTGSTAVFADETVGKFEAVLDYHNAVTLIEPTKPAAGGDEIAARIVAYSTSDVRRGHQDHVAFYDAPHSVEWKAWAGRDGQWMNQQDFALFVESRLLEVISPAPADLMQLALELQIHKAAEFRSEQVLQSGQTRFRYEETISGSSRGGELAIPKAFTIAIPVFLGEKPETIELLFRFRLQDAKLSLSFQVQRKEQIVAAAAQRVSEAIRAGLDKDVQFYRGRRA